MCRTLINVCTSYDMHVMNGRFTDKPGHFTCFSGEGASFVDYMIGSEELFNNIMYFNALERDYFDHVPIACRLAFDVETCRH